MESELLKSQKKKGIYKASLKKLEEKLKIETENREEIEKKYDENYKTHQELITLAEKQAEDIEILQYSNQSFVKKTEESPSSLCAELADLEERLEDAYFESPENFAKKSMNFLRASFRAPPRTLGVHKQSSFRIDPKKFRKTPAEEYFTLVSFI